MEAFTETIKIGTILIIVVVVVVVVVVMAGLLRQINERKLLPKNNSERITHTHEDREKQLNLADVCVQVLI